MMVDADCAAIGGGKWQRKVCVCVFVAERITPHSERSGDWSACAQLPARCRGVLVVRWKQKVDSVYKLAKESTLRLLLSMSIRATSLAMTGRFDE